MCEQDPHKLQSTIYRDILQEEFRTLRNHIQDTPQPYSGHSETIFRTKIVVSIVYKKETEHSPQNKI